MMSMISKGFLQKYGPDRVTDTLITEVGFAGIGVGAAYYGLRPVVEAIVSIDGEGCSERLQLDCNFPGSKEQPHGHWVVSICATYCDTTRAMCFYRKGTKYPNRAVAETCGSNFVRCLCCCALVLINALAMDIAVVDFVRLSVEDSLEGCRQCMGIRQTKTNQLSMLLNRAVEFNNLLHEVAKGVVMPIYGLEFSDWIVDGLRPTSIVVAKNFCDGLLETKW
ncbi:hypothetical protein HYC85_023909 [Camellia sinensis]|uniref:Pyruvate dehydrogenase E1 component subunit beta n=1 Tax=Camellia sinensis TaxID=4442 RepID=A0A7J7GFW6_CAMSI|nr:hypothetical protein HYC85_023909 [Camellia sinensis]